jgi:nucleoid DNA-binding protein
MTYIEVVELVAAKTNKPIKEVREITDSFLWAIRDSVAKGVIVKLPILGKFFLKTTAPKVAFGKVTKSKTTIRFKSFESTARYNPTTGEQDG